MLRQKLSRSRLIPRKYESVVFGFFMAFMMSGLMSLIVTAFNVGVVNNLVSIWLRAWGVAFSVAFPTIILLAPLVRKLSEVVLDDSQDDT